MLCKKHLKRRLLAHLSITVAVSWYIFLRPYLCFICPAAICRIFTSVAVCVLINYRSNFFRQDCVCLRQCACRSMAQPREFRAGSGLLEAGKLCAEQIAGSVLLAAAMLCMCKTLCACCLCTLWYVPCQLRCVLLYVQSAMYRCISSHIEDDTSAVPTPPPSRSFLLS